MYKEIHRGCQLYHNPPRIQDRREARKFDTVYRRFLKYRCEANSKWKQPESLGLEDASSLIDFLDGFHAFSRFNKGKLKPGNVLAAIQGVIPSVALLQELTILDADFSDTDIANAIRDSFRTLENCGPDEKSYRVAPSKILHAINPKVFVMWDNRIQSDYGLYTGHSYATGFLPEMKSRAERAIAELTQTRGLPRTDAVKWLTPCSNSLAKVLDEYNFSERY